MQIRGVSQGDPEVSGMKATNKDVRKPALQIPYKTTDTWTPSYIYPVQMTSKHIKKQLQFHYLIKNCLLEQLAMIYLKMSTANEAMRELGPLGTTEWDINWQNLSEDSLEIYIRS